MTGRLLVGVGQSNQDSFRVGAAEDLEPGGKVFVGEPHRHRDRRHAGCGCDELAVVPLVLLSGFVEVRRRVGPVMEITRESDDLGPEFQFTNLRD